MASEDINYISYYKNKKILVTGGAGFLGSCVIDKLSHVSCSITALDIKGSRLNGVSGKAANILFEQGDIRAKDAWQRFLKNINVIFHFAAQTSSQAANENPSEDLEVNLVPVVNLIEACHKNKLSPDIIFSGTATEAGLVDKLPVDVSVIDRPITVYDINKLCAEKYLEYYSSQMKRRSVVLRLSNVYGPGPAASSADRGILNAMIRKAINGHDLTIYGDGVFIRDYIYVDDVARAFLIAGADMDAVNGRHYVIGSGKGCAIKNMVNIVRDGVFRLTRKKAKIKNIPPPNGLSPIEFRNFIADPSAFTKATGWHAEVSLEDGINRTIEFFLRKAKC